jgi:hypothetical protein
LSSFSLFLYSPCDFFFFFLLGSIGSKLGVDCGLVRVLASALAYQLLTSLVVGIQVTYGFAG